MTTKRHAAEAAASVIEDRVAVGWANAYDVLVTIRDAIHRDGLDADAIRAALGLNFGWQHRDPDGNFGWQDNLEPGATYLRDQHGYDARRRVVGEWQEVQP